MKGNAIIKIFIGAAAFGLIFSLLYHVLVLKNFEEFDVVKNMQKGTGTIIYNVPANPDIYYLKFRTFKKYTGNIDIFVNDKPVTGLETDKDENFVTLQGTLPLGIVKPGSNIIKVLKNKTETETSADDQITLKNSRKKIARGKIHIIYKDSPLIPKNLINIFTKSVKEWFLAIILLLPTVYLSLKLLALGKSAAEEKLPVIDLSTYILPALILFALYAGPFFSKYYFVITNGFYWFVLIFFLVISKIVIYLSTAFRKEFASGFALIIKKAMKNPVNTMIAVGLFLLLMIPIPGLVYPYFPIRNVEQVADRDAELFANIAYVLLLVGAIIKFIKDYKTMRKQD